jgi:hypothetical protein
VNYIPYRQEWFYTKIHVPNLEQIQKEFVNLFWKTLGDNIPNDTGFFIVDYSADEVPALKSLLQHYDLADKWCSVGFSVMNNGCKFGGIHYDFVERHNKYLALNIPLLNCDGSYNVWYTGQPGNKTKVVQYNDSASVIVFAGKESANDVDTPSTHWVQGNITELDRVECTTPMLIHVGRPHQPEVTHDKLRVLLTIRFRPELTDVEFDRITALNI